jgi:hypothetical protein
LLEFLMSFLCGTSFSPPLPICRLIYFEYELVVFFFFFFYCLSLIWFGFFSYVLERCNCIHFTTKKDAEKK